MNGDDVDLIDESPLLLCDPLLVTFAVARFACPVHSQQSCQTASKKNGSKSIASDVPDDGEKKPTKLRERRRSTGKPQQKTV